MLLRFCFWFSKILLLLIYVRGTLCVLINAFSRYRQVFSTSRACGANANAFSVHRRLVTLLHNFVRVIRSTTNRSLTALTQYLVSQYSQTTLILNKIEQPPRCAIFNHSAIVTEAKCHCKHALGQTGSTWCIVSQKFIVEKKKTWLDIIIDSTEMLVLCYLCIIFITFNNIVGGSVEKSWTAKGLFRSVPLLIFYDFMFHFFDNEFITNAFLYSIYWWWSHFILYTNKHWRQLEEQKDVVITRLCRKALVVRSVAELLCCLLEISR